MTATAVIVVDPDGTPRSNTQFRMFASAQNAKKKIREEHAHFEKVDSHWVAKGYEPRVWKMPRIFEIAYTPEGGLVVTAEVE